MSAPRSRHAVRDLAVVAIGVASMIALWYLATPGPLRVGGAQLGPEHAWRAVTWAVVTLGGGSVVAIFVARLRRRELGLTWPDAGRSWWEAGALLPIVVLAVALASDPAAFRSDYPWPSTAWLSGGATRWLAWSGAYALYYLAYETFFRGVVLGWAERRFGRRRANVLQAILSTLVHLGKPWPETIAALPAGLAFGWLRFRWRSLLPVVLLHLAIGLTLDAVMVRAAGS